MRFCAETHTYEGYTSVGEFLRPFKKQFPADIMAGKVAAKDGRSKEEVLAQWELNKEISCDYGNSVHKSIELRIKYGAVSKLPHVALAADKFFEKYEAKNLLSELVVFNDEIKVAGTMDIVDKIEKGIIDIVDIKTNAEMTKEKIADYTMQLNMYRWMCEETGLKVRSMKLEHWNGCEFRTIEIEKTEIQKLWNK